MILFTANSKFQNSIIKCLNLFFCGIHLANHS